MGRASIRPTIRRRPPASPSLLNGTTFANVRVGSLVEDRVKNIENVSGGTGGRSSDRRRLSPTSCTGKGGNDVLNGGDGNDRLVGGAGADHFVFSHAPDAATNRDRVVDFAVGSDKIVLDHAIFAGSRQARSCEASSHHGSRAHGTISSFTTRPAVR